MKLNIISSNNTYFDYLPVWNTSDTALFHKVANAAGSLILNLGILLANICFGIGRLVNNLLSNSSTDSNDILIVPTPSTFPKPSAPPWDPNWGPYPG